MSFDYPIAGSQPHAYLLAANTPTFLRGNPFGYKNKVFGLAPAASTLYLQQLMSRIAPRVGNQEGVGLYNDLPRYARIIADGATDTFHQDDYPALANLHDDGGALTNANTLRLIVLVNGRHWTRVQSDVALSGGDFRAVDNTGMQLEIQKTGGGDLGNGTVIEVFMDPNGDYVTTTSLTAGQVKEIDSAPFMVASTAATIYADRP